PELLQPLRGAAGLTVLIEGLVEVGDVTKLEVRVARVIGERVEHIGIAHRERDRAITPRRFAEDAPALDRIRGADEWDDFAEQVILVAPGRGRVDVLVAADAGEAIRGGDHDRRTAIGRDETIDAVTEILAERIDVEEHSSGSCETAQREQRRVALGGVETG